MIVTGTLTTGVRVRTPRSSSSIRYRLWSRCPAFPREMRRRRSTSTSPTKCVSWLEPLVTPTSSYPAEAVGLTPSMWVLPIWGNTHRYQGTPERGPYLLLRTQTPFVPSLNCSLDAKKSWPGLVAWPASSRWSCRESNPGPTAFPQDFSVRSSLCLYSDLPVTQTSRDDDPSRCLMSPRVPRPSPWVCPSS
jgi:hypothetical protein